MDPPYLHQNWTVEVPSCIHKKRTLRRGGSALECAWSSIVKAFVVGRERTHEQGSLLLVFVSLGATLTKDAKERKYNNSLTHLATHQNHRICSITIIPTGVVSCGHGERNRREKVEKCTHKRKGGDMTAEGTPPASQLTVPRREAEEQRAESSWMFARHPPSSDHGQLPS